ncbi:hypothetical protein HSX11_15505 [Oxalobacteraceae bacterium]|nr:hypothetical protein [Oxalobacteraceae bacterium]
MSRMRIDFAPRSLRRALYLTHPAWLAGGVLALALCAAAAYGGAQLLEQRQAREQQLRHLRERQAALSKAPAPLAKIVIPEAQATFVNGAIAQLNLPWRDLQEALLAATPPTVALLTLEPDAHKQVLRLNAETRNSDDMIAYIEQLKQQELFSGVLLTRHEINEQDPNRPLRFQVEAHWVAR